MISEEALGTLNDGGRKEMECVRGCWRVLEGLDVLEGGDTTKLIPVHY